MHRGESLCAAGKETQTFKCLDFVDPGKTCEHNKEEITQEQEQRPPQKETEVVAKAFPDALIHKRACASDSTANEEQR